MKKSKRPFQVSIEHIPSVCIIIKHDAETSKAVIHELNEMAIEELCFKAKSVKNSPLSKLIGKANAGEVISILSKGDNGPDHEWGNTKFRLEIKGNIYQASFNRLEDEYYLLIFNRMDTDESEINNSEAETKLLRDFIDSATDGCCIIDSDMRIIAINRDGLKILGVKDKNVIGKKVEEISPFAKSSGRYEKYLEVLKNRKSISLDSYFESPDGEDGHYMVVRAFPVGNGMGIIGTDVTGNKEELEMLKLQKGLLESTFNSISDAVIVCSTDRKIIMANPAFYRMYKFKPEDIIGRSTRILYSSEEEYLKQGRLRYNPNAAENFKPYIMRCLRNDGEEFQCETIGARVKTDDGSLLGYLAIMRDISERIKFDQELTHSRQLIEKTFASIREALLIIDYETDTIMDCNPAAESMFGWKKSELTGKPRITVHVDEKQFGVFKSQLFEQVEKRGFLELDSFHLKRKDGSKFPTSHSVTPIANEKGEYMAWVSVIRDVTKHREFEAKLKQKTIDLTERVKELRCLYRITNLTKDTGNDLDQILQELVYMIPISWLEPENTRAKVIYDNKTYYSPDFRDSDIFQRADIVTAGKQMGQIEVYYYGDRKNNPFLEEESDLLNALASEIGRFAERKNDQKKLEETNLMLQAERETLERKNIAMREILESIEREKFSVKQRIQSNIDKIVVPLIRTLAQRLDENNREYLTLLENSLNEIFSPFVDKLQREFSLLAPRELEICNMVRDGMSSKQIASLLNISEQTVLKQRKRIRKKLRINSKRINLASYLKTVENTELSENPHY
ncbi:MAG: PAS domain S-box protein [candidate division Zixibacteria bacterium]|nr:PAS domain S-box protein [candidate division Zixibacteria bacterium]